MRRLLHFLLLLVFIATGLFFGSLNDHPVRVDYFFTVTEWPLAMSLAAFFFAGALFGGLITYLGSWSSMRRRVKAARRESQGAAALPPVSTSGSPSSPGIGSRESA